jgi:TolB-like protein
LRAEAASLRSIAVLPLQNLSSDPNQEFFAEGMTDELITRLAQVRELKVVSKTSVMQYKGTRKTLPRIGQELGVDAIVEGSVIRSGNRIRITAQLIRAAVDRHLWANSYEFEIGDVLSLQARVAEAITREVSLNLSAGERARLAKPRTANAAAYEAYLHGRYAWSRRNERDIRAAVAHFQQAIALDPNFASAYAGLADCYTLLALWASRLGLFPDARLAAQKALELDDGLAEAIPRSPPSRSIGIGTGRAPNGNSNAPWS